MPKAHPLFLEIAALLRELACDSEAEWSWGSHIGADGLTHAEEQMIEAGLSYQDAVYVLQIGKITTGEIEGEIRRYRVEEFTRDGVHAGFIVEFSLEEKWIEIVTAFRIRE